MPNKNYNSGRQFEYRVKKFLEQKGYYVMRSAGSKSLFDLIAIPTDDDITLIPQVMLVQCKHGAKISKKERDNLLKFDRNIPDVASCYVAWSKPNSKIIFSTWCWQKNKSEWKELSIW